MPAIVLLVLVDSAYNSRKSCATPQWCVHHTSFQIHNLPGGTYIHSAKISTALACQQHLRVSDRHRRGLHHTPQSPLTLRQPRYLTTVNIPCCHPIITRADRCPGRLHVINIMATSIIMSFRGLATRYVNPDELQS